MKPAVLLPIASLLSILLLTLHITDEIVRGISKAEPVNIALVVLAILLYGMLVLAERRSGHVIMLLVGVFAALMPVMPFPPGPSRNDDPITVSPHRGRRGVRNARSATKLPITTTRRGVMTAVIVHR